VSGPVPGPDTTIDPATAIGAVQLTVTDLERSLAFYEGGVGFVVRRREAGMAWLSAGGPDLLVLRADPAARRVRRTTGLFHFAILVPSRRDLGITLRHLLQAGTTFQGFAEHGVSEASYLADPDGNGIEIYRDRPREEWPRDERGRLLMVSDPLDIGDLVREGEGGEWKGLAAGTVIGHVHLRVADIPTTEAFYVGVLGFDLMQRYGREAMFVSAGGYHHHVAGNTWSGTGLPAPPPEAIGLRWFEVHLPDEAARARVVERLRVAGASIAQGAEGPLVRDPSGNGIRLTIG
jgi:catechol 2,3-dioxygenase